MKRTTGSNHDGESLWTDQDQLQSIIPRPGRPKTKRKPKRISRVSRKFTAIVYDQLSESLGQAHRPKRGKYKKHGKR